MVLWGGWAMGHGQWAMGSGPLEGLGQAEALYLKVWKGLILRFV